MIYSIFRILINWFSSFLTYFRPPSISEVNDDMTGIRILVKYGESSSIPLNVEPEWTICDVKKLLSQKISVDPNRLKIIFAGRELQDTLQIQDCDVGQHTVINAVSVKTKTESSEPASKAPDSNECRSLNESVLALQLSSEERKSLGLTDPKKIHFFVYCGSHCRNVCPGKLRVRCSECLQGTLTVSRDPNSWEDVLVPGNIPGECQSEMCSGTTADFYFRCASHRIQSDHESAVPLKHIKNNFKEVPCLACTEISPVILVFPCSSGHVICLECFKDYCISRLNERSFLHNPQHGYTLPCAVGCENSLIGETHHFRLLDDEQYSRYQRFAAEECLLQAGGVLCPQPGCGAGILPDPECKRITCVQQAGQGCGFVFCRSCLQGYHIGDCDQTEFENATQSSSYVLDTRTAEQAQWENASKTTIKGTTKPCPKCRTPTEKDGGCMHIVCTRAQCGFHWCWVCQEEWTRNCMGAHWFG